MDKLTDIKGIIFDYGGTIDSNGIHWAAVLWEKYRQLDIDVTYEAFWDAYVHGERTMGKLPLVKPDFTFYDTLLIKTRLEISYLIDHNYLAANDTSRSYPLRLAALCDEFVRDTLKRARPVLEELAKRYKLVLVSNFYGNVKQVLGAYGIESYFDSIIDSANVGVRKPDPAIFSIGLRALGYGAEEVVVVGDTLSKDIRPARSLGCRTIWIKPELTGDEWLEADVVITDFSRLPEVL